MIRLRIATPLLTIIPGLALIPVCIGLIKGIHIGGIYIIFDFIKASISPSLETEVIVNSLKGIQVTISIAILSWLISTIIGVILGFATSNIFWSTFSGVSWIAIILRRLLSILRSIHELVWGLILQSLLGLNPLVAIIAIIIPYSALVSRVISDQLDALNHDALKALRNIGSGPLSALTTATTPQIFPVMTSYGGYRFECALRGATLLGVFGMGGIGTELQLTLQSLQFREMWTSLWILGATMLAAEKSIKYLRLHNHSIKQNKKGINLAYIFIVALLSICLKWILETKSDLFSSINLHQIDLPTIEGLNIALNSLNWLSLINSTLITTFLAAGIAIGTPPLLIMLMPSKRCLEIQSFFWAILRLIPPPLTALLLMMSTSPSIFVAAFALGLHNIGIMGRLLKESVESQKDNIFNAIHTVGAGERVSWLYGRLSAQSSSYLAYSAYRTDVLLRETSVVGVVGGVGLGWQLQESLSSFAWSEVYLIIFVFTILTMLGEAFNEQSRKIWLRSEDKQSSKFSVQT